MTDDRARFEQRLGTVLNGKWTLESLLGAGGMAAVYAARHRIGTEVAIKMLHPEVARSKELTLRFEQEARVMAQLKHPGAVVVSDVDVAEDGQPFIVMELLSGEPLGERLRREDDIPLGDVLRFMDETLDVLSAAHARGIVHRDIKLDNLFICRDGRVKLLDFGIARVRDAFPLTMVGTRLGTLPYMPPEQVRGQAIDGRVDVFAAGAVMFRLLAKRRIHEASTEPELLIKMSSEPAPPLGSVAPSVPAPVQLVVDRALAFERDRRYPEARIMQEDIQAVRRGEPPPFATRRLALDGPPNPTALGAAASARPVSRTMATRAASPVALPRERATSEATAATALAFAPAAGLASEPTAAAASGALGAGAVLVNAPLSALGEPSPSTVDATPFEATAAPAAPSSPGAPVLGTARLPSAAAELAAHTMVSPGSAPAAEPTLVSSGQAALGSSPVPSAPDIAVESAAPAQSVASRAASTGEPPERRLPAGVLLSLAGAGLLVLVIAAFALWPSEEPAASEDTTRAAPKTAPEKPVAPPRREAGELEDGVAAAPVQSTQVASESQAAADPPADDRTAAPKSLAPVPSPEGRSAPPPAERPERGGPPPHVRGKGPGKDKDKKRRNDDD